MLEIKQGQSSVTRIVTSNKPTEINIMTKDLGRWGLSQQFSHTYLWWGLLEATGCSSHLGVTYSGQDHGLQSPLPG